MQKILVTVAIVLLAASVFALYITKQYPANPSNTTANTLNVNGTKVISRFKAPAGYTMVKEKPGSFGGYLQHLTLKPHGTPAVTYNGDIAGTDQYTAAIVDLSIGDQNLQQCADAVMRLRGEYLYSQKKYADISFNFTSGFKCDFVHYAEGYRYQNEGWALKAKKDYSYANFMRYLTLVFSYAGTLSLQKELQPVANPATLKPGDVFIRGGSPGHCFIVMNVAKNSRGQTQFLLAQSYMPAQSIQLIQHSGGPWFSMHVQHDIMYAELVSPRYLKRFAE